MLPIGLLEAKIRAFDTYNRLNTIKNVENWLKI